MTVNPMSPRNVTDYGFLPEGHIEEQAAYVKKLAAKYPELVNDVTSHPVEVKAKKNDTGKLDYTLLPLAGLKPVVRALEYGAKKYGDFNYKKPGFTTRRLCAATLRHLLDYVAGEDTNEESGLNHLAHVAANALILLEKLHDKSLDADDRYSKGA